jgi:hypothetical protein
MDINHKTYNNDLRKIVFVLSFMTAGAAATWKAQFIDDTYAKPIPANPNDRLGTYTQFRKDLMEAFSMFDSVGDTLDELRSLKKKMESMDKHIAKFKMLAAESKIDTTNPLSIELFKETLPWALTLELMKLETPLKTINNWYEWVATLYYNFSPTLPPYFTFTFHFFLSLNLVYLISLISGHESLIYDSFYLSLTHVHRFDSH